MDKIIEKLEEGVKKYKIGLLEVHDFETPSLQKVISKCES